MTLQVLQNEKTMHENNMIALKCDAIQDSSHRHKIVNKLSRLKNFALNLEVHTATQQICDDFFSKDWISTTT